MWHSRTWVMDASAGGALGIRRYSESRPGHRRRRPRSPRLHRDSIWGLGLCLLLYGVTCGFVATCCRVAASIGRSCTHTGSLITGRPMRRLLGIPSTLRVSLRTPMPAELTVWWCDPQSLMLMTAANLKTMPRARYSHEVLLSWRRSAAALTCPAAVAGQASLA